MAMNRCEQCGLQWEGRKRRFCSRDCQLAHWGGGRNARARATRSSATHRCRWCGKEWIGRARKFCSPECRYDATYQRWMQRERARGVVPAAEARRRRAQASHEWRKRICEQCGKEFIMPRPSGRALKGMASAGRFCTKKCSGAWLSARAGRLTVGGYKIGAASRIYIRPCATCERLFVSRQPHAKFCSQPCMSQAYGTDPRAKARRWQVSYERVNKVQVFIRDGWRCQLCGKKLRQRHMGTTRPDAPELDHIIPFAAGGEHTYRNTQCACRQCNHAKGKRPLGQLRLFA